MLTAAQLRAVIARLIDAGLRLAIISGAQFVTAAIAGRVSERVPARWLIGPGLVLVGVGLIVMGGLTGASDWTIIPCGGTVIPLSAVCCSGPASVKMSTLASAD